MVFNKDSGLVIVWVNMVRSGAFSREQVPKMFNLQDVVNEVLDERTAAAA